MQQAEFPTRVTRGLYQTLGEQRLSFSFLLQATCKTRLDALCPQLHQVVVKHKVSKLVKEITIIKY